MSIYSKAVQYYVFIYKLETGGGTSATQSLTAAKEEVS